MGIFVSDNGVIKELRQVCMFNPPPYPPVYLDEIYINADGVLKKIYKRPTIGELAFFRNDTINSSSLYTFQVPGKYRVSAVGNGGNGGSSGKYSGWTYGGGGGSGGTGGLLIWEQDVFSGAYVKFYRQEGKTFLEWYDVYDRLTDQGWVSDGSNGGNGEDAWPSFNPDNGSGGAGGQASLTGSAPTKITVNGSNGNKGDRMYGADAPAPPSGYSILQPQYVATQSQAAYADYDLPKVVLGNSGGGGWSGFTDNRAGGQGAFGGILIELIEI